jgi:hypothetical protein
MTGQDEKRYDCNGLPGSEAVNTVAAWLVGCEKEPAWAPVWRELMAEKAPMVGRDGEPALNARGEVRMRQRWRWQVALFIAYMCTPKRERVPESLEKLAELLGYSSASTFRVWRERDPGIDERIRKLPKEMLAGHLPDVYDALVEVAATPDPRANADRKLFFVLTGELDEKTSLVVTGPNDGPVTVNVDHGLSELSDEELDALDRIAQRLTGAGGRAGAAASD